MALDGRLRKFRGLRADRRARFFLDPKIQLGSEANGAHAPHRIVADGVRGAGADHFAAQIGFAPRWVEQFLQIGERRGECEAGANSSYG